MKTDRGENFEVKIGRSEAVGVGPSLGSGSVVVGVTHQRPRRLEAMINGVQCSVTWLIWLPKLGRCAGEVTNFEAFEV